MYKIQPVPLRYFLSFHEIFISSELKKSNSPARTFEKAESYLLTTELDIGLIKFPVIESCCIDSIMKPVSYLAGFIVH